jgi:hypothetical protein
MHLLQTPKRFLDRVTVRRHVDLRQAKVWAVEVKLLAVLLGSGADEGHLLTVELNRLSSGTVRLYGASKLRDASASFILRNSGTRM